MNPYLSLLGAFKNIILDSNYSYQKRKANKTDDPDHNDINAIELIYYSFH